jgi:hypothetical protein
VMLFRHPEVLGAKRHSALKTRVKRAYASKGDGPGASVVHPSRLAYARTSG